MRATDRNSSDIWVVFSLRNKKNMKWYYEFSRTSKKKKGGSRKSSVALAVGFKKMNFRIGMKITNGIHQVKQREKLSKLFFLSTLH